jgi:trehalose 6-phosphate phosphatase
MRQHLFDVLQEIGERIARAPHLLVCLDFDGTLAEIVAHPADARLDPETRRVLTALADRADVTVAIISGRARADLLTRVDVSGLIYAGNHGLEISGPGLVFIEPTAAECRTELQALAAELSARLNGIPGALVEDKGLTLTVHVRRVSAEQHEDVRRLVHSALANSKHPFQLTLGDRIYDVRPRVPWDKGVAVGWIREQIGRPDSLAIYLGDDATDEDAFAALREEITVRVGTNGETAAQFRLKDSADVRQFLSWLTTLRRNANQSHEKGFSEASRERPAGRGSAKLR